MVDAVVRQWKASSGLDAPSILFYADDCRLASCNALVLQRSIDLLTSLFARLGLQMNAAKSKAMIGTCGRPHRTLCAEAYDRRMTGEGPSFRERMEGETLCPPYTFEVSVPGGHSVRCPDILCPGRASTRDHMRLHFVTLHPYDNIVIIQEGLLTKM